MIPILEWLNMRLSTNDTKDSENLSNIVITIVFSIYQFLHGSDFTGHKRLVKSIENTGIFNQSFEKLKECG